jgi:hypothetical protein
MYIDKHTKSQPQSQSQGTAATGKGKAGVAEQAEAVFDPQKHTDFDSEKHMDFNTFVRVMQVLRVRVRVRCA